MPDIPRRSLAAGAGLLAGAMAFHAGAQQVASAVTTPRFRAQPLTINPDKVKGLSADLLRSHYDLYAGTVKRLNTISEELAKIDFNEAPPYIVNGLKREEQDAYNSTILHEIYFESIGEAPTRPSGVFAQQISRDYGDLDRWKAEFAGIGRALAGGSGFVILAYSPRDKRLFNHWAADHSTAPAGAVPLLTMDMYEHSYQMDYGTDAAKYVEAFIQAIKWPSVERLYREAIRV
jgi:Fe-Mn family superoxide dismutase